MYTFTNQFISNDNNLKFAQAAMMGPNAMRVAEEMASHLTIKENMRVLDLGCGCGLSTILLAQKYGVSVFAADLWIPPTDNYEASSFTELMIRQFLFPRTQPKACLLQTGISTFCSA